MLKRLSTDKGFRSLVILWVSMGVVIIGSWLGCFYTLAVKLELETATDTEVIPAVEISAIQEVFKSILIDKTSIQKTFASIEDKQERLEYAQTIIGLFGDENLDLDDSEKAALIEVYTMLYIWFCGTYTDEFYTNYYINDLDAYTTYEDLKELEERYRTNGDFSQTVSSDYSTYGIKTIEEYFSDGFKSLYYKSYNQGYYTYASPYKRLRNDMQNLSSYMYDKIDELQEVYAEEIAAEKAAAEAKN